METDPNAEIQSRIHALEQKIDVLTQRVKELENPAARRIFPPAQERTVPPVQPPPRTATSFTERYMPQGQPQQPAPQQLRPVQTAPQVSIPPKKNDTEYLIGAKILPKAGAVMMLIALTFLVILGYSRGWITPVMMFGIEVAFCSLFVIAGIFKRDLKEEFGQILTGIGSCGLYLVFAGGHLYYHLYAGETLVGLFFILSLANLAFSFWRSSQAFLALGLIGGLVTASVLPNLQSDHSILNGWIHFLILTPAALVVAKNKWLPMAVALWLAATIALIPILTNGLPWFDKVAILYASTALCLAAYGWSYRKTEIDTYNIAPALCLWVSGLIGFAIRHDPQGAWQYPAFFVAFGAMAMLFRKEQRMRDSLLIGAIGVPLTIAPYCFTSAVAIEILAAASIVAAIASYKFAPKVTSIIALVEFALASLTYIYLASLEVPWATECLILGVLIVSVITSGRALAKAYGQNEIFTLSAMAVCVPLFGRLSMVYFGVPAIGWRPEYAFDVVLVAFAYYTLALYFVKKWQSAIVAFWVVYGLALIAYVGAAAVVNAPLDSGVLVPMIFAPILSLNITPNSVHKAVNLCIIGGLFARLVTVVAVAYLHWSVAEATIVGSLVYATGCFVALWITKNRDVAYAGWSLLVVAGTAYATGWIFPLQESFFLVSAILACLVLAGRATAPIAKGRKEFAVLIALAGWVVFSRWSWLLLALAIPSLDSSPAVSIGWTVYFLALTALGFAYKVPQFRYVSFAVLATTLGKILLIDLATTDAMIRVAVTIVASLVMLAVGYWYVRSKEHAATDPNPS
jgi:hypothetical protein